MNQAIEVKDLHFAYQDTRVLENISFTVPHGQFVGIIGPNGGGKTTLLHLLMGFLKPIRGKITLLKGAKLGWVPQHFRYDRNFPITVLEVVLMGLLSRAPRFGGYAQKDKEEALAALDKVGMRSFHDYGFAALSGGQAQRVLLARALVNDPDIIFLDEPTANVDLTATEDIYKALTALKGKKTILMVTHDLRAAVQSVERVLCVEKTLQEMSPKQVCEHFALGLYHTPLKEQS